MWRLLAFQIGCGADEALAAAPVDRLAAGTMSRAAVPAGISREISSAGAPAGALAGAPAGAMAASALLPTGRVVANAAAAAAAARDLGELREAVLAFDGCPLKDTATTTVLADGVPGAPLMLVGEAPGREEDRAGLPFVGESGRLLDRMLAAIGMDRRRDVYISNVLPWRPPGNRNPSPDEIEVCLPFVLRHIVLARPRLVVALGGVATRALTGRAEGITRLRGKLLQTGSGGRDFPLFPTYHPAFLLRHPAAKREAWQDLLAIREQLLAADAATPDASQPG